jgi:PEP-CTERM motif-containing protein
MNTVRIIGLGLLCCFAALGLDSDQGNPLVTPEPSTIVMLATGLAGVGFAAWRRNRKR